MDSSQERPPALKCQIITNNCCNHFHDSLLLVTEWLRWRHSCIVNGRFVVLYHYDVDEFQLLANGYSVPRREANLCERTRQWNVRYMGLCHDQVVCRDTDHVDSTIPVEYLHLLCDRILEQRIRIHWILSYFGNDAASSNCPWIPPVIYF